MKVSTILSALAATALSIAVHAAPASTVNGNNNTAVSRINAKAAAAAKSPVEILPYCVGVASDDKGNKRVKIFKNKTKCDISGWDTLFVFTAYTNKDKHFAPYPMCVASGLDPNRSMLFSGKTSCTSGEWKTDFVFYESGARNGDKVASPYHQSTVMWQAYNPHRMMLYPYYEGGNAGWIWAYNLAYRSRYTISSGNDSGYFERTQATFDSVLPNVPVVFPPNVATYRCVLNLIQVVNLGIIPFNVEQEVISPARYMPQYVADANRDECKNLVNTSQIRFNRIITSKQHVATLEIMIANKVHAAILLSYDIWKDYQRLDAEFRMALEESLRVGQAIPVHPSTQFERLVARVRGEFVTMGKAHIYKAM
ncbi:hypothetical protein BGZ95_003449 [Linnemannia exigua]|uniref:Uncharacterized protein n=1 Tax=Linnemannia exigua TaxID=604196 RepID=A0AAD4DI85_9FUNG|nr:hypothetical protein BGZ95_003449 [Linnemannia exigua]